MTLFESFILSIFDVLGFIIISMGLIREENQYKIFKKSLIYVFLYSLIISVIEIIIPIEYIPIFVLIMIYIVIYLTYRKGLVFTFKIWFLSTVLILTIQYISLIILNIIIGNIEYEFFYGLVSQIIFIFIVIFTFYKIKIHVLLTYINQQKKIAIILLANIFMILIIILMYWRLDIDNLLNNFLDLSILSLSIIFIYFIVIKNGIRNEYEARELEMYKRNLPIIDNLISEVRRKQHEFDNHIQAINSIIYSNSNNNEVVESLKQYTSEIENINDLGNLIKLKDKILAGFLFSKQKESEKNNIQFNIVIENPMIDTKLKSYELIQVLGNLIDNAFETEVKDNVVVVKFLRKYGNDIIEVSNKHPKVEKEKIEKFFEEEFSTKKKKGRGYGLYNVKKRLNKYNIRILVENEYRNEYTSNFIKFRIMF